jgi:hypothetical protein
MAHNSIFYSYTKNINGFAAHVEEKVANQIASKKRKQIRHLPCILTIILVYYHSKRN